MHITPVPSTVIRSCQTPLGKSVDGDALRRNLHTQGDNPTCGSIRHTQRMVQGTTAGMLR